ncbi:MAG: condensation domain-containing protein [Frankiaceae bacterium]
MPDLTQGQLIGIEEAEVEATPAGSWQATATETLLDIVRRELDEPEMGPDDDFYAMGGDSLVALRVVTEAESRGIALTLRDLLYNPTVRELVAAVSVAPTTGVPLAPDVPVDEPFGLLTPGDRALLPAGLDDALPALAMQLGMIYQCEASGDPRLYHSIAGWEVEGTFDEALLGAALDRLTARHPALRTSFDLGTFSTAMQLVHRDVPRRLQVDRTDDDSDRLATCAEQWREHQLDAGIDWREPPLLRCHVACAPRRFTVTLAMHHAVVDGWSYGRLVSDLMSDYDAALSGSLLDAPPVPLHGHRELLEAEMAALASEESAAHWLAECDVAPLLSLRERLSGPADLNAGYAFELGPSVLDGLMSAARNEGTSLKSLVLGAFAGALGLWTGRERDVVTGAAVSTRPESADSDRLVGLFLNTLPMRFRCVTTTWADLAHAAREAERAAAPHRCYPLAEIERRLGRPAFDVSFNYANFHVYRGLDELSSVRVGRPWTVSKPSLPLLVDFEVVDASRGQAAVLVDFDPAVVDAASAAELRDLYRDALERAAADPGGAVTGKGAAPGRRGAASERRT